MNFRREFDLDENLIYLNSGSLSITPREVRAAVVRHAQEYERNPTLSLFQSWEKMWRIQKRVAKYFGADAEDLFLRPNITEAMNTFILGMPLKKGGEILVTNLEYGAIVNLCQLKAQKAGLTVRAARLPTSPENCDEESLVHAIVSELKPETRLVVLSHVMTGTGLILPITKIAAETRRRGILLAVDGAHAPGSMKINLSAMADVDFYGGNLHKWMLGPKGTSFGWIAPRNHEKLEPISGGWTTFEIPEPFAAYGDGSLKAARLLLSACHDFSPYFALEELLQFWEKRGEEKIFSRIYELQRHAEKTMAEKLGWTCISPAAGPGRGPLLTFALPSQLQEMGYGLMKLMLEKHRLQIVVTRVSDRFHLRLSPHIYNTEEEIDRAVQAFLSISPAR
jgi:isopenicillin-N epimerase